MFEIQRRLKFGQNKPVTMKSKNQIVIITQCKWYDDKNGPKMVLKGVPTLEPALRLLPRVRVRAPTLFWPGLDSVVTAAVGQSCTSKVLASCGRILAQFFPGWKMPRKPKMMLAELVPNVGQWSGCPGAFAEIPNCSTCWWPYVPSNGCIHAVAMWLHFFLCSSWRRSTLT